MITAARRLLSRQPLPPPDPAPTQPQIVLIGEADEPTVRTALTRAWRHTGQPVTVVVGPFDTPTVLVARAWVAEHAVAGVRVMTRCTALAATGGRRIDVGGGT